MRRITFDFIRPPNRRSTFTSELLDSSSECLVLRDSVHPSSSLTVGGQEVLGDGYTAVWFLFQGRPWDIARVYRPDGVWTGFYADILEPVRWTGADPPLVTPLVDLVLDLWINPAGQYFILDESEFEEALQADVITVQQSAHARAVLKELIDQIEAGTFPPLAVREYSG